MSEIRILVIFGNIPLYGQERANIQVMTCLNATGYDILFVTHDQYGFESIQPMLDSLGLRWTEARFPRLISKGMQPREWLDRIGDIVLNNIHISRSIRNFKPTHIHVANEYHFLSALPALVLSRIPIIYRLGDEPRNHRSVFRWLWRSIFRKRVSHFVCISKYIRRRLLVAGVENDDISVIYNFPPDRVNVPASEELNDWPGLTVTYVGQLKPEKGVDLLFECAIELCHQRNDVRFVFAGDYKWQNSFAESLIERAAAVGLSDRIVFPGFLENIPGLLAVSDVHACPSVWDEPLGNVVVEAKLAGVPSVVFPSGGLPELINHEVDGFICASKTQEALLQGLLHYLDADADYRKSSGREARNSLDRLGITREKFTDAWMKVYERD